MKISILVLLLLFTSIVAQKLQGQLPTQWSHFYNNIEINDQIEFNNQICIATDIGLFQIDKSTEIITFLNKDNSDLPDNHIQTLSKDQAGNLWIGTYNIAMVMVPLNGGNWTIINYPSLANPITVYNSDIAPNGDLWLACNQGVLQHDGQTWTQHMISCAASGPPEVWDVKVNSTGKVFAGSFNLFTLENGQCNELVADTVSGFSAYGDVQLSLLDDTTVFFLADGQFIRKFDGHSWQNWNVSSDFQVGINFGAINPINYNNSDFTYLGSDNVLLSYTAQGWQKDSSLYNSLVSSGFTNMSSVVIEPNGDFWGFSKQKVLKNSNGIQNQQELVELKNYSTYTDWTTDRNGQVYGYKGLPFIWKVNGNNWDTAQINYGTPGSISMLQLYFDHQNDKWISGTETSNWSFVFLEEQNGSWVLHDSASSGGVLPPGKRFFMVFTTNDNRTIIRDTDLNYYQYYNGSWSVVSWLNSTANYSGFASDDNDDVWFIERTYVNQTYIYKLKKFNGSSVDTFTFPQSIDWWSLGTRVDKDGHVWMHGPQDSLYEFDGTNFTAHPYPATTASPQAMVLKDNHIFLALYGQGILHFDGTSWNLLDRDNSPMSSNNISTLLLNENGDLWMSYNYTDIVDVWHSNLNTSTVQVEGTETNDLKVYPNPVQQTLILETTLNNATLQLFDINGRMLLSQELINKVAMLNMEKLPAASYVVRVHNNMESQQKIIMKK